MFMIVWNLFFLVPTCFSKYLIVLTAWDSVIVWVLCLFWISPEGEFHQLPRKCQNPLGFDLFSLINFFQRESHVPLVLLVSTSCLTEFPFLSIATAASSARAPRAPRSTCPPAHNTTAAPRIHTSSAPTWGSFWPSCLIKSYCSATTSTNDETGR